MQLDLGQVEYQLWNIVFLPVLALVAASVVRAIRAETVALERMYDRRVRAINEIESDKATSVLMSIVGGLLPRMARGYVEAEVNGSTAQEDDDRKQELHDRLTSQDNVRALCTLLEWGGRWAYLKESHRLRIRQLRVIGTCGFGVGLLLLPLAIEAMTPRFDLLPQGWVLVLGVGFVVSVTAWAIAAFSESLAQNCFSRIVQECE